MNVSIVVQCSTCSKHINVINKPICCGIIYCVPYQVKVKEAVIKIVKAVKKKKPKYSMDIELRKSILKRDKNKCTKCKSKQELHIHHIIHRENGGSDDKENLVTLCELCHAEEHKGEPIYNLMIQRLFQYTAV